MTLSYDLYWSFRSPYSYLVDAPAAWRWSADYDVACVVRPVYPLAVRTPEFFEQPRSPVDRAICMTDVHPRGRVPRPAVPLAEARSGAAARRRGATGSSSPTSTG